MNAQSKIDLAVTKKNRAIFQLMLTVIATTFLFLGVSGSSHATENFYSNPTTLYPPACVSNPQISELLPSKGSDLTSGVIRLQEAADKTKIHDVNIRVFRRGCSETDRSVLMFEMHVIDDMDGIEESVLCPEFEADRFGTILPLRGTSEPNSWTSSGHSKWVAEGETITLFLDGMSIYDPEFDSSRVMTVDEYNGDWELKILDPRDHTGYRVDIREYRDQHALSSLPLSGRLSGTWVVDGVPDQGFVIAFQELADQVQPYVFLSWYTFDQDGKMIWLTGGQAFEIGASQVDIPVDYVTGGAFLGSKAAERSIAGSAKLAAVNCNDMRIEYDLSAIGLGMGIRKLQRIFSIETQGYACRDAQARLETQND